MRDERAQQRVISSPYQHWAKTRSQARFNLASSGVRNYPLSELPVKLEDLELSGPSLYGYEPLQEALAAKCDVAPECVVAATGTSMANHLVMAAIIEPGDEVLIEHPTYELLVTVAQYLGANVSRFMRNAGEGFQLDLEALERSVSARTRLIVLTNLNNPTGALTDEETLKRLGEIARGVGAHILIDEVYLEALFERAPRSAFHLGEEFVTTNSLTKVYGLSGLRCGWILATPELAERMWRLNDLFGVIPAHPAERLSLVALAHLDEIAERARKLLMTNSRLLNSFFATRDELEWMAHSFGTTSFPRLRQGSVEDLCSLLGEKYETSVVPGRFFEMEQHFRIGIGGDTETLKEGLDRLGRALDEIGR
ncbi:MAG TPA: aminotransferase class I/II-fold pyridoxal phosphate-dependent enzyme [Pyrinomonadaceae bacterium]|jgi:aspartate/methionine/tyrosine aminotransferase|nr:aminotransferase class I/II-fold pyridoxal phosphate-dependent enzyme [Pyrinomonadaceae bacterium]